MRSPCTVPIHCPPLVTEPRAALRCCAGLAVHVLHARAHSDVKASPARLPQLGLHLKAGGPLPSGAALARADMNGSVLCMQEYSALTSPPSHPHQSSSPAFLSAL